MAKNISISDDLYKNLSKLKRKNESFSDVIRRLLRHSSLAEISGTKIFSDQEWEKIKYAYEKQNQLDEERKHLLIKQMVD